MKQNHFLFLEKKIHRVVVAVVAPKEKKKAKRRKTAT